MKMINIGKMIAVTTESKTELGEISRKTIGTNKEFFANPHHIVSVEAACYNRVLCTQVTLSTGEKIPTLTSVETICSMIKTYSI